MSKIIMRGWIPPLAFAGAVAVVVVFVFHALRPVPRPCSNITILGPEAGVVLRLKTKARIAAEVSAGRLTLLEAAAALKALDDAGCPYPRELICQSCPGDSEEEVYCRMAIRWVRGEAPMGRADAVAGPLEEELAARLKDGTLHLPEPTPSCSPDIK